MVSRVPSGAAVWTFPFQQIPKWAVVVVCCLSDSEVLGGLGTPKSFPVVHARRNFKGHAAHRGMRTASARVCYCVTEEVRRDMGKRSKPWRSSAAAGSWASVASLLLVQTPVHHHLERCLGVRLAYPGRPRAPSNLWDAARPAR
jgi:hypothetical protein